MGGTPTAPSQAPTSRSAQPLETNSSYSQPPPTTPEVRSEDAILQEGQRALEREKERLGIQPPPVSGDGRVHLRSGGSISEEQYRDVQRRLNQSPVMQDPPMPPPVR